MQLFLWLLIKGRIQCRTNLFTKKIVENAACLICGAQSESPDHIIFHCPIASDFWRSIGLQADQFVHTSNLHCLPRIRGVPDDQFSAFITLCCWQLWKRRNAFVFRQESLNLRQLLLSCKSEANLWRARMPKKSKIVVQAWCNIFDSAVESLST